MVLLENDSMENEVGSSATSRLWRAESSTIRFSCKKNSMMDYRVGLKAQCCKARVAMGIRSTVVAYLIGQHGQRWHNRG